MRVSPHLEAIVAPRSGHHVELLVEAHYHSDTALCAFGPDRRDLLVWPHAITPAAWDILRLHFGEDVLELPTASGLF